MLVVGDVDAQVLLVLGVPDLGQVLGGGGALEEALLDLVADQDVEGVGQLVGLGADQAGLGLVDGQANIG